MGKASRTLLPDVLLGINPNPSPRTKWSSMTGREFDLVGKAYGLGNFSVACNLDRIGHGTVGWIYRSDGSYGHLAGLIVFESSPYAETEPGGTVHYCDGYLWPLPQEWWIDGARIHLHKDWSGRAPFGKTRRFRNGEQLQQSDRQVLFDMLHPVAQGWIDSLLVT